MPQIMDIPVETATETYSHGSLASYQKTMSARQEVLWHQLSRVTLHSISRQWLKTIQNPHTCKSYGVAFQELFSRGFLDPNWTLQTFALVSPEGIIDRIKTDSIFIKDKYGSDTQIPWSERTRESRIACFLSFTRYLSRKTEGMVRHGVPGKEGIEKTFGPKPRRVKTEALTRYQLIPFFEELDKINPRDAMIARLCLHGAKRINEVLSLKTDQIDYDKRQITFKQSKSCFADDVTIISFDKQPARDLLFELKRYIGERKGDVFVTQNNKRVQKTQVDRNFSKAGKRAGIDFRVSPHNLRATAVTLWKEDGFQDSLIMKVTGHASTEMVRRYDKTDIADNVTKKSCLL
jgi:integrase/recombinase XerD